MANIDLFKIKINGETGGGGGKPATLESLSVTINGYYIPSDGVDGYSDVNVNVTNETNYRNYDGSVDVEGLRAIGWDDESIGMLRDNSPHYAWQNGEYVVSEENKSYYGKVKWNNVESYGKNESFIFCPMFSMDGVTSMVQKIYGCKYLKAIPKIDTSNVDNMQSMLEGCVSLITIPKLNTSKVGRMTSLFSGCSGLTSIPLLDTSSVWAMGHMFRECNNLTSIPELNTSNVTDMNGIFFNCGSLTSIPKIDTSNVTNMSYMFSGCSGLTSIPQLNTSNVTNMSYMFSGCSGLTSIPQLNTSNVTDIGSMFSGCSGLTSIPLLDTSKVTGISYMFSGCKSLTSIPELNTSNVTNMDNAFASCKSLTTIPQLNTSMANNMGYMFYECTSLTSIPELDCSNVRYAMGVSGFSNLTKLTDLGGFKNLKASWSNYFIDKVPNATVESLVNVLNGLYDFTNLAPDGKVVMPDGTTHGFGTTHTVKFGSANLAKLTDEQKAIATNKGWTLT